MIYYLSLLGFFAIFSTTLSKSPVLPLFSQALGADDAIIGLVSAFSPLAGILFSFPVGVLSDHFGRKRLLVASGAVFLIAPFLYLFINDPLCLIPVRFFHGTATAILGPVISAIISERFPEAKGEVLGQYSSSTLVGRTIAPLTGGMILALFAGYPGLIPYRMVYILAGIAAIPVFVMVLRYREEQSKPLAILRISVFRDSLVRFLTDSRLRATASADMAIYFAFGALETFLPLVLLNQGIGVFSIGIIFAVQVLVIAGTKPFFGRLADRFDKRIQIIAGLLIIGISLEAIIWVTNFPGYLTASVLFGLGLSLSSVATSAYIADIAKPDQIGASMGALSSIMDIGHTMGPVITGILIGTVGMMYGFQASFIMIVIVGVFFAVSVRDIQRN
ncbi:MAG: MFS transporter [Methanoregula sp.]|nr:MFS transporter [Methanoregula sp.]